MLALGLFASGPAAAQADTGARYRVDARTVPWTSVGKLQAMAGGLRSTCTAALIGPRTLLSAAHCLFDPRTQRYFPPASLHFLAGLEAGSFVAASLVARIAPSPDYDPARPDATRGADWSVLTLAGPVASAGEALPLAPSLPAIGTELMVGGYGQDNPNMLLADLRCHVTGIARDAGGRPVVEHSCGTARGISGAPLLARTAAGWTIVGVNVAHARSGPLGLAAAVQGLPRIP